MRAYCDDRAAALSLAAALQAENDLLRAENEHLRELVDPGASRWRGAFAQASSAVAVTLMLLGAMFGAGVIVEQTASAAEADVSRDSDLGARLAVVSPHDVIVAPSPPAVAAPALALPEVVIAPSAPPRHRRHARHHHHHRHHRDQG
jgi:hypothetical protein